MPDTAARHRCPTPLPDTWSLVFPRAVRGLGARAGAAITAIAADQLRRVAEEGCTEAQGFLLGRPMTPDAFARLF